MNQRTVISEHVAIYADPISVRKGDILLLGKSGLWDGHTWIWATSESEKSGWVPDNLAREKDGQLIADYDYSAAEVNCGIGAIVEVIREDHGWAWCRTANNDVGWIPLRNLSNSPL